MKDLCLIVGSGGFVGKWLRDALVERGFSVRGFDVRPSGAADEVVGDIFDAAALREACAGAKVVCHLVALQSSRAHGWDDFYRLNVTATERIVAESVRAGVEHLVYFSTELVYGKQASSLVREDAPLRPWGHYGKSKAMAEEVCARHDGRDLRVTILRPSNIFGPGKTRVVDELFDRVNRNAPIPLIGGRSRAMQVIDVRDVARITSAIIEGRLGGVYNVGTPNPATAYSMYSALVAHAGSKSRLIPVPAGVFRRACLALDRVGASPLTPDQYHRLADSWILDTSKLEAHVPYAIAHDGVKSLLETYDAFGRQQAKPTTMASATVERGAPQGASKTVPGGTSLAGRVVVVTGASRGIGEATAVEFSKQGARVALIGRDTAALAQVQHRIESAGGQVITVASDVRDPAQVENFVRTVVEKWGRIDVLVNNAGVTNVSPLVDMELDQIRDIVDVNLTGTILCTRAVLPHFIAQRSGHIVNVSSILGKRGIPRQAVYSASKAAILRLSESLRSELAPYGITVTGFCPSSTQTAMNAQASAGDPPLKQMVRRVFMQTPEGVARQIVRATVRRRREVVLSLPAKTVAVLNTVCPAVLDRLFARGEPRS